MRKLLPALLTLLVCACASHTEPPLTPMPEVKPVLEPSDTYLKADILSYLENSPAPQSSTYDFKRVDLNGDGMRDALVMMKTPYGYWCDTVGCKMLIMQAREGGFNIVNAVEPAREPVFVSDNSTNGWRNILMRVSGLEHEPAKNVILRHDGQQYPITPLDLEQKTTLKIASMERVFER